MRLSLSILHYNVALFFAVEPILHRAYSVDAAGRYTLLLGVTCGICAFESVRQLVHAYRTSRAPPQ